jgi:hypothetical protein
VIEPEFKCSAPECGAFGVFVFRRRNAQGAEVTKRACAAHRARGEAWFAKGAVVVEGAAPPPAAQGSLL